MREGGLSLARCNLRTVNASEPKVAPLVEMTKVQQEGGGDSGNWDGLDRWEPYI